MSEFPLRDAIEFATGVRRTDEKISQYFGLLGHVRDKYNLSPGRVDCIKIAYDWRHLPEQRDAWYEGRSDSEIVISGECAERGVHVFGEDEQKGAKSKFDSFDELFFEYLRLS